MAERETDMTAPRPSERRAVTPNFLIIGAAKSGTTSLYHHLGGHEDVFLSPVRKEGRYYSGVGEGEVYWPAYYHFDTAPSAQDYAALFAAHAGQKAIGDVSPDYFAYAHKAAPRILAEAGPETRIIVILRNPVKRAFSHYLQNVRRDAEFFSFEKTLELEAGRKAAGWGFQWLYADTGKYAPKLKPYIERFEHMLVLTQDELAADPQGVMSRVQDFLGLAQKPISAEGRFNTGGIPQSRKPVLAGAYDHRAGEALEDLHPELVAANVAAPNPDGVYPPPPADPDADPIIYPDMPAAARARLEEEFAPEIDALEALLKRDFSAWRPT